jgi:hypothetical protein
MGASMIERMSESSGAAIGFRVAGTLTEKELKEIEPQLEVFIAKHKKHPIGILVDMTAMSGAEWKARWEDLRFLQKHTDHIARMSIVGAHGWNAFAALLTSGGAILESETRYFEVSEMEHAWQWARTAKYAEGMPIHVISPATGIWKGYHPEYMDV